MSTSMSSSTDEETSSGGFMLASANPKKRAGRKKFKETRHPVFRGVRQRNSGKWVCEVREPNKKTRIWLGTFQTPEMAARAHDVAALALRRGSATLNFADSAWRLPVLPASSDTKDIQRAAAEAADAFRPREEAVETSSSTDQGSTAAGDVAAVPDNHEYQAPPPAAVQHQHREEQVYYMDEDTVFGMPGLLADMYQGMMLSPPPPSGASYDDDVEFYADVPLWSYSI